jgi:hypothetical protein
MVLFHLPIGGLLLGRERQEMPTYNVGDFYSRLIEFVVN